MRKKIFVIFGFLLLILLLWIFASRNLNNLQKKIQLADSEIKKTLQLDKIPTFSSLPQLESKEFTDSEKKFKITYPGGWFGTKDEKVLEAITSPTWKEKYNLETLFVAQKVLGGKMAQLIVTKGIFNIGVAEIIEEMKKTNEEKDWTMEIISSDIKNNEGNFEAKYRAANGTLIHSRDKILKDGDDEVYLVTCFSMEKDWPYLSEEIKTVVSSAHLTEFSE